MIPGRRNSRQKKRKYLGQAAADSLRCEQLLSSAAPVERRWSSLVCAYFCFLLLRTGKMRGSGDYPCLEAKEALGGGGVE